MTRKKAQNELKKAARYLIKACSLLEQVAEDENVDECLDQDELSHVWGSYHGATEALKYLGHIDGPDELVTIDGVGA